MTTPRQGLFDKIIFSAGQTHPPFTITKHNAPIEMLPFVSSSSQLLKTDGGNIAILRASVALMFKYVGVPLRLIYVVVISVGSSE